jgi:pyruvate dehydrogenase E2 component (dihydrolipoamide acetyltransferase)
MAETITMPKLGFDMQEGTLVRWVKSEGENINKGDVLAEIETDKATVEVESSASGVIRKLLVDQGAVVPIGAAIALVGTKDEKIEIPSDDKGTQEKLVITSEKSEFKPSVVPPNQQTLTTPSGTTSDINVSEARSDNAVIKASPLARRVARDENVDLTGIRGSGPGGRVVKKDIETAMTSSHSSGVRTQLNEAIITHGDETIIPTKLRQAIARRMVESKTTTPHFYVSHEYKMDAILALRKQINEFLSQNEQISVNDFIVKSTALALREFPNLNASFAGNQIIRHGAINVGVAVAVDNGLLTVVSKDADKTPLIQISKNLKRMAAGAREGKVRPEDIEGSTFSISNLGMYDVENFIAILNPPEAAILAVGSARSVPVVGEDGEIKVGSRMKATISVDHRVSDGAEAARFMQALAKYLEEPLRLLV